MTSQVENDQALGHLADALRCHDWMSATRALDYLAQSLSNHALAHDFSEVSRVSHQLGKQARQYLLSKECSVEIGKTLASRTKLSAQEILEVHQPAALQVLVGKFASQSTLYQRAELHIGLLDLGRIDLCRNLFSLAEIQDATGVSLDGSPGSAVKASGDHWEAGMLTGVIFSSLIQCYRRGEKPEPHWIDLISSLGEELSPTIRGAGYGADAPLALKAFGIDGLVRNACEEVLGRPMIGDIGHLEKLASCGYRFSTADKGKALENYKLYMTHRDNSDVLKDQFSTIISSMMALDFDENDDYAFASGIVMLPQKIFDKALCDACNYLWEHRGDERKKILVSLMDHTYDAPSRILAIKGLLNQDMFKHLKLGREQAFAADLGL